MVNIHLYVYYCGAQVAARQSTGIAQKHQSWMYRSFFKTFWEILGWFFGTKVTKN